MTGMCGVICFSSTNQFSMGADGRIGREPLRFDSQPTPHSAYALLLRVGSFRAYRE